MHQGTDDHEPLLGSTLPFNDITSSVSILDVWGEGRIVTKAGEVSGFHESRNLNKSDQMVSNGPTEHGAIPNLVPVTEYNNPRFPMADGVAENVTLMGAPITPGVAREMYRVVQKPNGLVYLYGPNKKDLKAFEDNKGALVRLHHHRLVPPFNEPNLPGGVLIYGFHDEL